MPALPTASPAAPPEPVSAPSPASPPPGSCSGASRKHSRDSGGGPEAAGNRHVTVQDGTPPGGLRQVVRPAFAACRVDGTSRDRTDPAAGGTPDAGHAARTYGSADTVDSAH